MNIDSCRVCLTNHGSIPMFTYYKDGIAAEVISSVFKLDVAFGVHLPRMICSTCMQNIKCARKTKDLMVRSQITLSRLVGNTQLDQTFSDKLKEHSEITLKSVPLVGESNRFRSADPTLEKTHSISIPTKNQEQAEHTSSSKLQSDMMEEDISSKPQANNHSLRSSSPLSTELTKLTATMENSIASSVAQEYHCGECEFKTDTYKTLLGHIKSHSGVTIFECELCGKSFKYKFLHNKHKTLKKQPCHNCGKMFCDQSSLLAHRITHVESIKANNKSNPDEQTEAPTQDSLVVNQLNIEPTSQPTLMFPDMYACEICDFKTNTYRQLVYHMRIHADVLLYECERCGIEFKARSRYNMHRVIHRTSRPFKCKQCGKRFKGRSNLTQHLLTHKTAFVIACPKCDKMFRHQKGLNAHLLSHNEKNEACYICNKTFKHTTFLKTHLAGVHGVITGRNKTVRQRKDGGGRIPCEFCGKLVLSIGLRQHISRSHSLKGGKTCAYCDKQLSSKLAAKAHMQCHFNSKKISIDAETKKLFKYKCDQCDKCFVNSTFLKNHKILHSGVKEHVCMHCGKGFAFKMYLDRHVRLLHDTTNPRNFNCGICGKVSACGAARKAHMLSHTGETPFHCQFCEAKFVYSKSLRIHMNNKHKSEAIQK